METQTPKFRGIFLQVSDVDLTVSFYQLLDLEVERVGDFLARAFWPDGKALEFGTIEITSSYDSSAAPGQSLSSNTIGMEFATSSKVDENYTKIINAGFLGHLAPFNSPWGARFAIVKDPDGNQVGLHGPRDQESERRAEETSS